jgi:cytochrome c oxidase subunit 2
VNQIFSLPEASTHAARVDQIFYGLLLLSGLTLLLVFGLVLVLSIRYRRGSTARARSTRCMFPSTNRFGW